MEIILTHENADFDAVASMLGAYKLNMDALPILPKTQHANVREFLTLYKNGLPFIAWDDFDDGASVKSIIITDTARRASIRNMKDDVPTLIFEHHPLKRDLHPYETWAGDDIGAATTLLVERIRERKIELTSLEATLMALGIYADTGNFTYGGTTSRDIRAAAWLLEHGAVLDTVQRFLNNPLNQEQQTLLDQLMENIDSRSINGFDISLCTAHADKVINSISSVVTVLRDILDADALIVLVSMPEHVQLIARSTQDAIHVGELAKEFTGGGHPRASAAAIHKANLEETRESVWRYLRDNVRPAVRIAHLMSFGEVQTVDASEKITDIIARIRRIAHEGYPVLDEGKVVGLLTLNRADKALEHGLKQATVRDVMEEGKIALSPDDPVSLLEETMVESKWGQIPIIDDSHKLIGIVTRTDLIKHWAQTHPAKAITTPVIESEKAEKTLGQHNIKLIAQIATFAQSHKNYMYMVGGVARDLLLERSNFDIDFVIEGDAIEFAEALQAEFGGRVHPYPPFRTATWTLDEASAGKLGLSLDMIPDHLDFATARSELYEHPTALPTVYNSGIKLDLRRRDFTINTLAIQLSPQRFMWQILDFYGGLPDLDSRLIRVLHSLSFVDDPTRILRAVRFSERLQFTIEPRTTELIQTALPMLKRITGERLQNEIALILQEENAARAILKLEALSVLKNIHSDFQLIADVTPVFHQLKADNLPDWIEDSLLLRWHLLMAHVPHESVSEISQDLLIGQSKVNSFTLTATLVQDSVILRDKTALVSDIVKQLSPLSEDALMAIWLSLDDSFARERIEQYRTDWRHIKPTVDGNTLKDMGLKPGPAFRTILERLRNAWINGLIYNEELEKSYLKTIIDEVYDERSGGN